VAAFTAHLIGGASVAWLTQSKKQDDGYYAIFNVTAPGGALDEAERAMRIADDVLRHKLLRLPDAEAARRGLVVTANS